MNTGTSLAAQDLGALLHETFDFSSDTRLLELFLHKGAAVDCPSLQAIQKAVTLNHHKALELMIKTSLAKLAVQEAFERAWNANKTSRLNLLEITTQEEENRITLHLNDYLIRAVQETPCSKPLISFLLKSQASVGY
jgi:hypothetical protein